VRAYVEDPLCGFDFTASGFYEMLSGFKSVASPEWGKRIPDIPVLIASGTKDAVSGKGKGPELYASKLRATGHSDVTLKMFIDDYHEILNELDRADVYEYIRNWLEEKVGAL